MCARRGGCRSPGLPSLGDAIVSAWCPQGRGAASWRLRNAPASAAFPAFGARAVLRDGHLKRQIQLLGGDACPPAAALRAAETAALPARETLAGSPFVTKAVLAAQRCRIPAARQKFSSLLFETQRMCAAQRCRIPRAGRARSQGSLVRRTPRLT